MQTNRVEEQPRKARAGSVVRSARHAARLVPSLFGKETGTPGPAGQASEAEPKASDGRPMKWWHWFLVYPALLTSLVASIPAFVEKIRATQLNVPYGESKDAAQQARMWQVNAGCMKGADLSTTVTARKAQVGTLVCASGDVLVFGKFPEWDQPTYRWVPFSEIVVAQEKTSLLDLLIPSAYARPLDAAASSQSIQILCQKQLGGGRLQQRVRTATGCVDQTIDTHTGKVVSSKGAPCNDAC